MSPNTHLSESGRGTWAPRVSSRAEDREGGPPAPAPASAASTWDRARDEIVRGGHRGGLLLVAILGLGYLALAQFVLWTNDPAQVGMNFWPAAGLTLGTLLLLPTRRWAWALAAIALAEITSDVIKGHPASVLIWLTIADTTEPLIGATLVRGFTRHRGALVPVRGLVEFVAFAVIAAPIAGSALGTIGTTMAGGDFLESWPRFFVGDALGVLVVAPVILSARAGRGRRAVRGDVLPVAATIAVSVFALHAWPGGWDTVTPYLVIPPLTWVALHSGVRGASWAVLGIGQVANLAVATGTEPFVATSDTGYTVTLLQAYLAIAASSALVLASAASELSDRDALEEALRLQALHDPLTGLPNRIQLLQRLNDFLAGARERGVPVAMCVVDLDSFKHVNDSYGHPAGDAMLVASARRLQESVRETDLVARIGGDEFVVLLGGADDSSIDAITRRIVDRISAPLVFDGAEMHTTVSVGVAITDGSATPDALFRDADSALYRAKSLGRNQVARFDSGEAPLPVAAD
ncbi:MAG: sensor domain-containing diguanylate cyclase [Dehalococcoidia bacterium]|nr:sensor domain-containing diguanylate cyclase [Dehalococcoidia bacterium]